MHDRQKLSVQFLGSITGIDPKQWQALFPPSVENHTFFKTVEKTLGAGQFKFHYITIQNDTQTICIAPCFIMDYPLDTTIKGYIKKIVLKIKWLFPRFLTMRVLVCGSAIGEGKIGLAQPQEGITATLSDAMRTIARREKAVVLGFKDFSAFYAKVLDGLTARGFYKITGYPSVALNIQFKTFEEYLGSLSKVTRKDLGRKFKKIASLPAIRMEVHSCAGQWLDEAFRLYENTFNKSDVHFEKINKEFLKQISEDIPGQTKFFFWFLDNKLIAFDLCLVSGDALVDEYFGADYATAYNYHPYFLTFRDIINWCIANGIRTYHSWALNYELKKRLKFNFLPNFIYARHIHPVKNIFFGLLCALLKPENFDPLLRPVKEQTPPQKSAGRLSAGIFLLILMTDVIESCAQLFFKKGSMATGMDHIGLSNWMAFAAHVLSSHGLWAGALFYIINFFVWMIILKKVDLSLAFPIGSFSYVIVAFFAMVFLHEHVPLLRWAGIGFIITGVYFLSRSTPKEEKVKP